LAEEPRPISYYKSLSLEALKGDIAREETLLAGFKDQLGEAEIRVREARRLLIRERLPSEERLRVREATIRELETRIRERARKIRDLEEAVRRHEARLPYVSAVEWGTTRRVIASLRRFIKAYSGWQTRDRRSLTTYRGWQTREAAAIERYVKLERNVDYWSREVSILGRRIIDVEAELEKKRKALPRYLLVEYTKYFEVVIVNPDKTPPIRFELRGEFTIPAGLAPDDPRVLTVIEAKLTEAFVEWGKPWEHVTKIIVSDMKRELELVRGTAPEVFTPRAEGGWWWTTTKRGGGINISYYEQGPITYGGEIIEETDTFKTQVEVEIVKYVKNKKVELKKPWITVTISEDEFPTGEEEG